MTHSLSLKILLKKYRLAIVGVVFLSVLESLLFVAQFYFIGKAVNDLLKDSWNGIYILIALFVVKILVSYVKQKRIGLAYEKIYEQLVTEAIGQPLSEGEKIKVLAPKSTIIYEVASFFKGDLIKGFESIVRLILVLVALFLMNKMIFLVALILGVVVFFLYFLRKKKTVELSHALADELMKEHQILQEGKSEFLFIHHKKLEKLDNELLGVSAFNLSIIEILSFTFMVVAIIILVKTEGENALGTFFTMLYYVMAFTETMFLLPSIYQKYLRTQELSKMI